MIAPGVTSPRRLSDSNPDPRVAAVVKMRVDRLESVVTCRPTSGLDPHLADGQVQLVVNYDEAFKVLHRESPNQRDDRQTGVVHVRLRDGSKDLELIPSQLRHQRTGALFGTKTFAGPSREQGDDVGPGIVPRTFEFGTGIAQPDNQ